MTRRSTTHTSFVIDRQFSAPPKAVFKAWSDPQAKRRWSDCHSDLHDNQYSLDFRPGGSETHRVVTPEGAVQLIQKHFFDVAPDERIIFAYDIELDRKRLSVSLVTVEFQASRGGTRMVLTEQVTYLDGHGDLEERIRGTNEGLDRLELELSKAMPV